MAKLQFTIHLDSYCGLIKSLQESDNNFDDIIKELRESAVIINDEDSAPYLVRVKINSSYIGCIIEKMFHDDSQITEEADALLCDMRERIDETKAADERKKEYAAWLTACFDKYVIDIEMPNSKEMAALINKNELKPGDPPLKFQSIMRPLKEYRRKRFQK